MKLFSLIFTVVLSVVGFNIPRLHAQASIQAAGGEASGPGGSASYTLGQVVQLTATGPGGTGTAGVQQPLEIFLLSTTRKSPLLDCSVYPNPTSTAITLDVNATAAQYLTWRLTDMSGRQLLGQPVAAAQTTIPLATLSAGAYLLVVVTSAQEEKTFKIIKH
jgi:hypothetical protein